MKKKNYFSSTICKSTEMGVMRCFELEEDNEIVYVDIYIEL